MNPEWQKARCDGCRIDAYLSPQKIHHLAHYDGEDADIYPRSCTAPPPEEYIAELEAENARQSKVTDDVYDLTASLHVQVAELLSEREKWRALRDAQLKFFIHISPDEKAERAERAERLLVALEAVRDL